jgi:hypothetical protein
VRASTIAAAYASASSSPTAQTAGSPRLLVSRFDAARLLDAATSPMPPTSGGSEDDHLQAVPQNEPAFEQPHASLQPAQALAETELEVPGEDQAPLQRMDAAVPAPAAEPGHGGSGGAQVLPAVQAASPQAAAEEPREVARTQSATKQELLSKLKVRVSRKASGVPTSTSHSTMSPTQALSGGSSPRSPFSPHSPSSLHTVPVPRPGSTASVDNKSPRGVSLRGEPSMGHVWHYGRCMLAL